MAQHEDGGTMGHRHLLEKWFECLERGDMAGMAELAAPDVECVMPGAQLNGWDQVSAVMKGFHDALPDMKHGIVRCVESGGTLAAEIVVTGTMTGPLQTPQGAVPPTGRKLYLRACDFVDVEDGRITSISSYFDNVEFLAQLGIAPGS
jgi:steroid delta-isomerase-like uncharacterized protein